MFRALGKTARVCPVLLAASCGGGEPPPPVQPKAPQVAHTDAPPPSSFASPAKWSFHPPTPMTATAAAVLPDGSCLFTTDDGLRFVSTESTRASNGAVRCKGRTTAASDIALDELVGIVERPGGVWMFVGWAGNLYEAEGPLAPFRRTIGPPTNFTQVTGSGNTVLAVTVNNELLRLDDSLTWRPVKAPKSHYFDVGVGADGRVLALGLPERLFTSSDGETFVEAPQHSPVGAYLVGRTPAGLLATQGIAGTIVWEPSKSPAFAKSDEQVAMTGAALDVEPSVVPTASAVVEGRAALDGDRYAEVVVGEDESGNWRLAKGKFDGQLTSTSLENTNECAAMRIGARGRHITTVCLQSTDEELVAIVRQSSDGGVKFGEPIKLAAGDSEMLGVAVSNDGSALVTGACKAKVGGSGCAGSPPILLERRKDTAQVTIGAAPPLMGLPIAPAFSADGRSAYFLARRAKDEKLTLYVSHDAGRTFAERSLRAQTNRDNVALPDDGESYDPEGADESIDPSDLTTLRPADDGTLGLVLTTPRGLSYLTADEDGRVLDVSTAPDERALIGGYGRRVIALSSATDSGERIETSVAAWESSDGGGAWNQLPLTRALIREVIAGPMTVACSSAGCLVGTTITRVGWDGQTEAAMMQLSQASPSTERVKAVRAPIVCIVDSKTPWSRINDVWSSLALPTLHDVGRGRAVWSILSFNPATSAVSTTFAQLPERGEGPARVSTRSIFAPAPKGSRYAVDVSHQVEGYAAARVRVPAGDHPEGPMRNIEVAWENFFDGLSGRTSVPDAGNFAEGDIKVAPSGRFSYDPALMSVTSGAIAFRPHSREATNPQTFLLDAKGKRTAYSYPDWASNYRFNATFIQTDTAVADGKLLIVGTVGETRSPFDPLIMLLAPATADGSSTISAMSLFPQGSKGYQRLAHHDWTYRGTTEVGVATVVSERDGHYASAVFMPFHADGTFGPPTTLPTPYDLPDIPRPCKADDRRTTARFAAHGFNRSEPMYPGERHPVLVVESQKDKPALGDTLVLLTSGVTLHGSKQSPCVAGWEAVGVTQTGIGAVIAGDPSQAWLFRRVRTDSSSSELRLDEPSSTPTDGVVLEHRPMSCRYDSSATVPDSVWSQPGTMKQQTK